MGFNNLRLVKVLSILCIMVLVVVGTVMLTSKDDAGAYSFRPMIKIDGELYLMDPAIRTIDVSELELLGEVEFSYETPNKGLNDQDVNFSSNLFPKHSKIYKYDDTSVILVSGKDTIIFRKDVEPTK